MGEITARPRRPVEELEAKAHELAGEEFMLGSTQQVARILFEKLELTPGRKGKTATRPTPAFCGRSAASTRSCR
jgi:DNA polymerase I-like protein with 3'-5' exonuclease and polymerase domains